VSDRCEFLMRKVAELENSDRASRADAFSVIGLLLASYPSQEPRDDAYVQQLVSVCEGVDLDVLKAMVNPHGGVIATCRFLPSIAEVLEWLDRKMSMRQRELEGYRTELRAKTRAAEPEVPKEVRDRLVKLLDDCAAGIREKARVLYPRKAPVFTQVDATPDQRMAALKNLGDRG
jgi:hypothetical protein